MSVNEFWANRNNIRRLELYTKLIGLFFSTLGINFLIVAIYCKRMLNFDYSGLIFMLSVIMFMLAPIAMSDPKRQNRTLSAVIADAIFHSICTIGCIILTKFWGAFFLYGIELLVVVFFVMRARRGK